ncbi:MAG TPA: hypothetical protein VJ836_02540 [Candidatus Saccharimonadales bacterium]|nr:hypothetical protein [Candidatus Saccharimonadales bacterium]
MKVTLGPQKRGLLWRRQTYLVPHEVVFVAGSEHDRPYLAALATAAREAFKKKEVDTTIDSLVASEKQIEAIDNARLWREKERLYRQTGTFVTKGVSGEKTGFAAANAIRVYEGVMYGIGLLSARGEIDAAQVDALCNNIEYAYPNQL